MRLAGLQEALDVKEQAETQRSSPAYEIHSRVGLRAMESGPQEETERRSCEDKALIELC